MPVPALRALRTRLIDLATRATSSPAAALVPRRIFLGGTFVLCPCHDAVFDPSKAGAAIAGPTNPPLAGLPLLHGQASGTLLQRLG